jgi:outer membrane immunogenic protein
MKNKLIVAAATLAFGVVPAAHAQDMGGNEQPFSGIYVGAAGGYDMQGNDIGSRLQFDRNGDGTFGDGLTDQVSTSTGADAFAPGFCNGRAFNQFASNGCENDRNRASYYARVGFDKQMGRLVVGAVGEFGKSEIKDFVAGFSSTPASYTFERSLRWEASARLRAGVALGSGMFYATGGAGYADIKHRFETTNTTNAFTPNNDGKKKFGFIVGGGVEKFVTRNISVGAEYTYHDYKDNTYNVLVTRGAALADNPFVQAPNTAGTNIRRADPDFRWHSLRGTVAFHF